jgi:putative endonuclease
MWSYNFYVYIITNPAKTVYYVGMTNNLESRMKEHRDSKGKPKTFAGRYYCYNLVYYERHSHVNDAIDREDALKLMSRKDKEELIRSFNPKMLFLNIYE